MTLQDEEIFAIIEEELEDIRYLTNVLTFNINRVFKILHKSNTPLKEILKAKEHLEYLQDISRAAIVFLHSSLETTIREIVKIHLMNGADLSKIKFINQNKDEKNKSEKFSISDLAIYRGKTVNEVIEASIENYIYDKSFNNKNDITSSLSNINFPQETLRKYYDDLDKMINKRHKIVHEADLKRGKNIEFEPINADDVANWINITFDFCQEIIKLTFETVYVDKIIKRLKGENIIISRDDLIKRVEFKTETKYKQNKSYGK